VKEGLFFWTEFRSGLFPEASTISGFRRLIGMIDSERFEQEASMPFK
jgi:hypothetical protein